MKEEIPTINSTAETPFNDPQDLNKDNDFYSKINEELAQFTDESNFIQTPNVFDHSEIINRLLEEIENVDFRILAGITDASKSISKKHYLIGSIETILEIAQKNNWGICINQGVSYLYNGVFWNALDNKQLEVFLGIAAEKMGVDKYDARHYAFREQLCKQFYATAHLQTPVKSKDTVLINLRNGTFEIRPDRQELRPFQPSDFLTYQLPFDYNPKATAPLFKEYLNKVLPNQSLQMILAEYLAYLFINTKTLKLEKALILYGGGANGKSVFFEIVYALLGGSKNVSNYSLQSLTNESGGARAMLANKLLNYASEMSGKLDSSIFKLLVAGEPVEARRLYHDPFSMVDYAKLIFNCNELPRDVEHTNAYFRRFLIVPFEVIIPEAEQDKQLASKIIDNELSGIFNWILEGLQRLLSQKNFTKSEAVDKQLANYKEQSDSVQLFLSEERYEKNCTDHIELKVLFPLYRTYCSESNCDPCSKRVFCDRLRNEGVIFDRKNYGMIVYLKKTNFL